MGLSMSAMIFHTLGSKISICSLGRILWLQNSNVGGVVLPDSGLGIFLSRYTQFSLLKDEINLYSLQFTREIINENFKVTKVTELMSTLSSLCVLRLELPLNILPP